MTELVNNAVRHSGVGADRSLRVDIRRWPERVRVTVVDPGTGVKPVRPPLRREELGGWGLFLVDRIADRWGVSHAASGACVWFEIEFAA